MNTYEILKQEMTKGSRPGSMGRSIDLNKVCDLFIKLRNNIKDLEASTATLNADLEVRDAILVRRGIEELKAAGVLSND